MLPHERLQFLEREVGARRQLHERLGQLAGRIVGHADHGNVEHLRMRGDEALELRRWHLETVVLDEFLDAVNDREVAVLVDDRDVAGVEPAIGIDGLGSGLGVVEVTLHHHRATDPELASFPNRLILARFGVDDAAFDIADRNTAGAGLVAALRRAVGHRAELGHAEALDNLTVDALGALVLQLDGERRSTGENLLDRREVVLIDDWRLCESEHHRWHGEEAGDLVLGHEFEGLLHVETGHGEHGDTVGEHAVHQDLHAVDVEERQSGKADLVVGVDEHVLHLRNVRHQVVVGEHHAFGKTRRARRVRQRHYVIAHIDLDLRDRVAHERSERK